MINVAREPIYRFDISKKRLDTVAALLPQLMQKLTQDEFLQIIIELQLYDGLTFDEQGNPSVDMTELQQVALVAGMAAVVEAGIKQVLSDRYRDPGSDILTILS